MAEEYGIQMQDKWRLIMRQNNWENEEKSVYADEASRWGMYSPGISATEIRRGLVEYNQTSPQNVVSIRISSTLVLLRFLYFLSIDHLCWGDDSSSVRNAYSIDQPEFPKPSWEAILTINYSRPPNH